MTPVRGFLKSSICTRLDSRFDKMLYSTTCLKRCQWGNAVLSFLLGFGWIRNSILVKSGRTPSQPYPDFLACSSPVIQHLLVKSLKLLYEHLHLLLAFHFLPSSIVVALYRPPWPFLNIIYPKRKQKKSQAPALMTIRYSGHSYVNFH